MNINSLTGTRAATSRRARAAVAASLAALALGMTVLLAPSASAASEQGGDFSSRISGNPNSGWLVDDCYGDIGFVFDPRPAATGWHHIGGVRVNYCNSRHSFISATVTIFYWNGSSWVPHGSTYDVKYNATSSGYPGILYTPASCTYGWRGYWKVGATVSTERWTQTVFSSWAYDPPGGAC
jgi:hypothetical protein